MEKLLLLHFSFDKRRSKKRKIVLLQYIAHKMFSTSSDGKKKTGKKFFYFSSFPFSAHYIHSYCTFFQIAIILYYFCASTHTRMDVSIFSLSIAFCTIQECKWSEGNSWSSKTVRAWQEPRCWLQSSQQSAYVQNANAEVCGSHATPELLHR